MPEKPPTKSSRKAVQGVVFLAFAVATWFVVPLVVKALGLDDHGEMVIASMAIFFIGRSLAMALGVIGVIWLLGSMVES